MCMCVTSLCPVYVSYSPRSSGGVYYLQTNIYRVRLTVPERYSLSLFTPKNCLVGFFISIYVKVLSYLSYCIHFGFPCKDGGGGGKLS